MSQTVLDREWESLMALCRHETELKQSGTHPKLLQMVAREIDRAATKMGFDEAQIRRREFRAEKANGRGDRAAQALRTEPVRLLHPDLRFDEEKDALEKSFALEHNLALDVV
jgi:hypothetical protein